MKRKYSDEEKQKIIDRYISGNESPANILADSGIPKSTFYSWLKTYLEEQEKANERRLISEIFICLRIKLPGWRELSKFCNLLHVQPRHR